MSQGRHAGDSAGGFYRDLAMMIGGIILVGAAVFLVLYLLNRDDPAAPPTSTSAATSTTSTAIDTSTSATQTTPTTTPNTTSTSEDVPVRSPGEIRVVVLNSVGIAGAAGRMSSQLEEAGYQTIQPGDFDPEQDPSRIWYREGFSAEASQLLEFVPDALVEPLPDEELQPGADIVLVLGTGYNG